MKVDLFHGDCIDIIKTLINDNIKVDAIITDPPYGTTKCSWDSIIPLETLWTLLNQIRKDTTPILLFGQEPFSSKLRLSNISEYRYDIYWEKERATNIFQVKKRPAKVIENVSVFYKKQPVYNPQMTIYNGKRRSNKIKYGKLGELVDSNNKKPFEYKDNGLRYPLQVVKFGRDILKSNLHPTQKPLALMEYLVKTFTNEGDTVLDFTMGSGTTGVACLHTNRCFIGIEKDEKYFNIAKSRIENEQKEIKLFNYENKL